MISTDQKVFVSKHKLFFYIYFQFMKLSAYRVSVTANILNFIYRVHFMHKANSMYFTIRYKKEKNKKKKDFKKCK